MRSRLRSDLTAALRARDPVAVSALRSALAAIENAEAIEAPADTRPAGAGGRIAGAAAGVGAGDRPRRTLADADIDRIVRSLVEELRGAAAEHERLGRLEEASRLRAEAGVLAGYVG